MSFVSHHSSRHLTAISDRPIELHTSRACCPVLALISTIRTTSRYFLVVLDQHGRSSSDSHYSFTTYIFGKLIFGYKVNQSLKGLKPLPRVSYQVWGNVSGQINCILVESPDDATPQWNQDLGSAEQSISVDFFWETLAFLICNVRSSRDAAMRRYSQVRGQSAPKSQLIYQPLSASPSSSSFGFRLS